MRSTHSSTTSIANPAGGDCIHLSLHVWLQKQCICEEVQNMTGAKLLQSSNLHNSHLNIFKSFGCTFFVRAFDSINPDVSWIRRRRTTDMRLFGLAVNHAIVKAIYMPAQLSCFFLLIQIYTAFNQRVDWEALGIHGYTIGKKLPISGNRLDITENQQKASAYTVRRRSGLIRGLNWITKIGETTCG